MRESISLSGAITQSNLFTYDYDASGRPKNSNMTFNSTSEAFGFTQTRAGRTSGETDPYSTSTASYDTAAGRLQNLTPPEGATTFGSYDPEGEVLAFTEPNSTTAVSQGFDSIAEMTAQTPPGADPNGCALGFTAVGSEGFMTTTAQQFDGQNCGAQVISGTEDVRNAVQTNEQVQFDGGTVHVFESAAFDADGRLTLGYNGTICCGLTQAEYTHAYDAESRLLNQKDGSGYIQMKRIYGPDGHIVQIGTEDASHVLHMETLHWDGDAILFTTNDAGQTDDVKIGNIADYFPRDPTPHAMLTVWDRDFTGHMRGCHNGGGHSAWSKLDPYNASGNPLPSITGCAIPAMYGLPIGQGGAILQPDGDGYWDGFVMIQGARDYDSTLRAWIEPDPSSGSAWDPMTQKAYSWNNNNPSMFGDPTGLRAGGGDNPDYDPSQGWLEGIVDPGFEAGGVDANGDLLEYLNGSLNLYQGGLSVYGPIAGVDPGVYRSGGWILSYVDFDTNTPSGTIVTGVKEWTFDPPLPAQCAQAKAEYWENVAANLRAGVLDTSNWDPAYEAIAFEYLGTDAQRSAAYPLGLSNTQPGAGIATVGYASQLVNYGIVWGGAINDIDRFADGEAACAGFGFP
jgi:hypothetical protein